MSRATHNQYTCARCLTAYTERDAAQQLRFYEEEYGHDYVICLACETKPCMGASVSNKLDVKRPHRTENTRARSGRA